MRICKTVIGRHFVMWRGRRGGENVARAYACVFSNSFLAIRAMVGTGE